MLKKVFLLCSCFFLLRSGHSQNLPSLLLGRNINATFSIVAYDEGHKEWGIAVATNNIYVGNSTIYIEPGVGAFSVIAETEPMYAVNGFRLISEGKSIEEAIKYTIKLDNEFYNRQVAGIDAKGNVYAFTGSALKYWKGVAGYKTGKHFVVMGNQLADSVLSMMAETFEQSTGTLAERLLKSLIAGQQAGGQLSGKQSAALVVRGSNNEWFNQIDLRVDNAKMPFAALQQLLNYHVGRIRLNQAINLIKAGDKENGEILLHQAEQLVEGWNGIYNKIVLAYILLGNEEKAVTEIWKALKENPQWKENIAAFYCLNNHPEIKGLMDTSSFSLKDWNNAISIFLETGRCREGISLAEKILKIYPASSGTFFQLGKALYKDGNKEGSRHNLETAIQLDQENDEARQLLKLLY